MLIIPPRHGRDKQHKRFPSIQVIFFVHPNSNFKRSRIPHRRTKKVEQQSFTVSRLSTPFAAFAIC
jgi:hypothetical protein